MNQEKLTTVEVQRTPLIKGFESVNVEHMATWCRSVVPDGRPVILPFSGGLDSATIAALLAKSIGSENVYAVHVVHNTTQPQETERALKIAHSLGIRMAVIDLTELRHKTDTSVQEALIGLGQDELATVDATKNAALVYGVMREITRRMRGKLCGTLDGSEILTGYYPKETFGGDFLPLAGLLREEVRALARELGLSDVPTDFAVTQGCGSILTHVQESGYADLVSEHALDGQLSALLRGDPSEQVEAVCKKMLSKARTAVGGRPVYYPSQQRQHQMGEWIS